MKTYSDTAKRVLEKAAEIKEENSVKAHKTRSRIKTIAGAALAIALVFGAVLVIKPFGERGGDHFAHGADSVKSTPVLEVTPDCAGDSEPTSAPEPAEPIFITDTTAVKSYEQGDAVNAELSLSLLRSNGYIEADTGILRVNYYNTSGSVLRNCTPDYIREHSADIELFQDESSAYFIKLDDTLYRYDSFGGRHINMCLWDHDNNGVDDLVFYSNFGSGLDYHAASVFDLSTRSIKEIIVKMTLSEPSFPFDFDGENIYIYSKKVEYSDGEFFIGGIIVQDYSPVAATAEPQNTPEATPSGSISAKLITEASVVWSYHFGDAIRAEHTLSIIRANGYIDAETGELCTDHFGTHDTLLRNCSSECIRENTWGHTAQVDLFDDGNGAYFVRINDTAYRFDSIGGRHICMCLWDYDKNGIDDIVFYRSFGSSADHYAVNIFDVSTRTLLLLMDDTAFSPQTFSFDFDGKGIYIDYQKVEYADGQFFIGGVNACEYSPNASGRTVRPDYPYPTVHFAAPDDFAFTIQWGIGAYSSYDSATGRLVKTTDTTHPEDYIAELFLDEYSADSFYTYILYCIDFFALPAKYDPINAPASEMKIMSEPHETIILTVRADGREKTVTCPEIPLGDHYGYCYEAYTFYNIGVRYVTDLLMSSPEWQALPEYEFFYE